MCEHHVGCVDSLCCSFQSELHGGFVLDEHTDEYALTDVLLRLIWAIPGGLIDSATSDDLVQIVKQRGTPAEMLQMLQKQLPAAKKAILGWLLGHWQNVARASNDLDAGRALAGVAAWAVFLGVTACDGVWCLLSVRLCLGFIRTSGCDAKAA